MFKKPIVTNESIRNAQSISQLSDCYQDSTDQNNDVVADPDFKSYNTIDH